MNSKNKLNTVGDYADMLADVVNSVLDCELHCPDGQFVSVYRVAL